MRSVNGEQNGANLKSGQSCWFAPYFLLLIVLPFFKIPFGLSLSQFLGVKYFSPLFMDNKVNWFSSRTVTHCSCFVYEPFRTHDIGIKARLKLCLLMSHLILHVSFLDSAVVLFLNVRIFIPSESGLDKCVFFILF